MVPRKMGGWQGMGDGLWSIMRIAEALGFPQRRGLAGWKSRATTPIVLSMLDHETEEEPTRPESAEKSFRPFIEIPGDETAGLLLLCDHASNALPPEYGTLGLPEAELERHIGYDIGAAGVMQTLSRLMGVPGLMTQFSRLLIDPNRGEDDPTLVMRLSDGAVIPGNAHIDGTEIKRRIERFYRPYHEAVDAAIDRCIASGKPPVLFSIHSFTDRWKHTPRPWHTTILFDRDLRFAKPLVEALRDEGDIVVGENVPYSGELENDCMSRHGTQRGLAHALIEIRQDLIREPAGQKAWGERLARILAKLLTDPSLAERLHTISTDPHVTE